MKMENIQGKISIESLYGDVEARGINSAIDLDLNRSDLELSSFKGSFSLKALLSEVRLSDLELVEAINIKAERSKIDLALLDKHAYDLSVDLSNSQFQDLIGNEFEYSSNSSEAIVARTSNDSGRKVSVNLITGTLTLK